MCLSKVRHPIQGRQEAGYLPKRGYVTSRLSGDGLLLKWDSCTCPNPRHSTYASEVEGTRWVHPSSKSIGTYRIPPHPRGAIDLNLETERADMMCHPKTSDVSLGRDHRVLPGLRLRHRLRARRHVLHLSGRIQGSGTGRSSALAPAPAAAGARPGFRQAERVSQAGLPQQQILPARVQSNELAFPQQRQSANQTRIHSQRPDDFFRQRYGKVKSTLGQPQRYVQDQLFFAVRRAQASRALKLAQRSREKVAMPPATTSTSLFAASRVHDGLTSSNSAGDHGLFSRARRLSRTCFHPTCQQVTGGGELTTRFEATQSATGIYQASAIVLVTISGNVPSLLQ